MPAMVPRPAEQGREAPSRSVVQINDDQVIGFGDVVERQLAEQVTWDGHLHGPRCRLRKR
jgi:hypothetical protein